MGIRSAGDGMSLDGRSVANFVLDYCEAQSRPMTPFSLQKVVYFCHVWTLIKLDRPLIRHAFEAWEHGPVLPYLYRDFKEFGDKAITARALGIDKKTGKQRPEPYELDSETEALLGQVVNFYSRMSFSDLYALSHVQGGPWDLVWRHGGAVNPGMKVDNALIKDFYSHREICN